MLIAALIFVLSMAALVQFVVLQWRAGLVRVASTSVVLGNDVRVEAAINLFRNNGFSDLAAFHNLCPDLGVTAPKLRAVRLYHGLMQLCATLGLADWAKYEIDLCVRYATAVLAQQVARNQAFAAQATSF
jgi:hypothetical protein